MATTSAETNPRGLPKAPFIESVEKFLNGNEAEHVLRRLDETLATYKRIEQSIREKLMSMESALPEMNQGLQHLESFENAKGTRHIRYQICDSLYGKAKMAVPEKVCLWIGANVMVEFTVEEARKLMTEKVEKAKNTRTLLLEDLEFLREQITTVEVNIARVYNWDVKNKKAAAGASK